MNILERFKRAFRRRRKPEEKKSILDQIGMEIVGVWVFFQMDGPFLRVEVCENTTKGPPKHPAILIVDRTLGESLHLVGKSIDWSRFRFYWRKELEQGTGYCRFRYHELLDWIK
jgi:hypothetical protein